MRDDEDDGEGFAMKDAYMKDVCKHHVSEYWNALYPLNAIIGFPLEMKWRLRKKEDEGHTNEDGGASGDVHKADNANQEEDKWGVRK